MKQFPPGFKFPGQFVGVITQHDEPSGTEIHLSRVHPPVPYRIGNRIQRQIEPLFTCLQGVHGLSGLDHGADQHGRSAEALFRHLDDIGGTGIVCHGFTEKIIVIQLIEIRQGP